MKFSVFDEKWTSWDMLRELHDLMFEYKETLNHWKYIKKEYMDNYQYKEVEKGSIEFGQIWDGEYTYFFEKEYIVPKELENKKIMLKCDIQGEGEVYVNGKALGSLDYAHDTVVLLDCAKANEKIDILIMATKHVHDAAKCYRMENKKYPELIFRNIEVVVENEKVRDYYYFANILLQVSVYEKDTNISEKVYNILKNSLLEIDYYDNYSEFCNSVEAAKEKLETDFANLKLENSYGTLLFNGHSHLDLVFKWRTKDTIRKIERTNSNTLGTLSHDLDTTFTQSQMQILLWTKEYYPEQFEEMKKYIAEGRLEIIGGLWAEFDTNIPSGESIIRHILYGKKFMRTEFGIDTKLCYLPDTFGYSGILPQILKKSGYEYFVTAKLDWNDTNKFPYNYFIWEGIDGSAIKSYLMPKGYGGPVNFQSVVEQYENSRQLDRFSSHVYQYGEGDGGGGISDEMVHYRNAIKKLGNYVNVKNETLESSLEIIDSEFSNPPVQKGELYFEKHRGVYTSQAEIKTQNRKIERKLHSAEVLSVILNKNEQLNLEKAWKKVMHNHFHDIISGTMIQEAVNDTKQLYKEADEIITNVINSITEEMFGSGTDFVIFNTLGWNRNEHIILKSNKRPELNYADGTQVKMVDIDNNKYLVYIEDIPSFGYKVIKNVKNCEFEFSIDIDFNGIGNSNILENKYYKIIFDEYGDMISLYDKVTDKEILSGKGNVIEAYVNRGGYFDSWDIKADFQRKRLHYSGTASIEIVEDNELRKTIEVIRTIKNTTFKQYISIYDNEPIIDFDITIDANDKSMLYKTSFEVDIYNEEASFDVSLGHIFRRTTNNDTFEKAQFEVPMHKWFDLSQHNYGLSFINESKYGCDVKGNKMRLTLLKTAVFPDPEQDIGIHNFRYLLNPHKESVVDSNTITKSYEYNTPVIIKKNVSAEKDYKWLNIKSEGVFVETIKHSESDNFIIMRLVELYGEESTISLDITSKEVYECDLLEQTIRKIDTSNIHLKPFEIKTIKVK